MSRIIENEELIEKIRSQRKPSGRYEQIISDHAGEIAMYLCDISKSLAAIADSKKAAIAKYSVGDIVEFKYGDTRRGRIKNSYVRVSSNSNMSGIYYDIALLSNYYLLTDIEEKDIIMVYKKEEEKEEEFDGYGNPFLDALYRSFLDLNGRPYVDTGTARSCNCANSYLKKEKEKNEKGE